MSDELQWAAVRVPCSTSNLGAGFDTVGLALNRYLVAEFKPTDGPLSIRREGTLAQLDVSPADDLLVVAFAHGLAEAGHEVQGALRIRSEIPLARGLGSSAAALVAGHELARAVLGRSQDRHRSFQYAYEREGHGDNAAPCALGGLRGVVRTRSGVRAVALDLSRDLGFAFAAPSTGVSTARAREVLPSSVNHGTAVGGLGRLTALVRGLADADAELVRVAMDDQLHVPFRLPLIPGATDAMAAGYEAGAWGVTISGSGSGMLAIGPVEKSATVAHAMVAAFGRHTPKPIGFAVRPDWQGAAREPFTSSASG